MIYDEKKSRDGVRTRSVTFAGFFALFVTGESVWSAFAASVHERLTAARC